MRSSAHSAKSVSCDLIDTRSGHGSRTANATPRRSPQGMASRIVRSRWRQLRQSSGRLHPLSLRDQPDGWSQEPSTTRPARRSHAPQSAGASRLSGHRVGRQRRQAQCLWVDGIARRPRSATSWRAETLAPSHRCRLAVQDVEKVFRPVSSGAQPFAAKNRALPYRIAVIENASD